MEGFVIQVIAAFLLFAVALPLAGVIIGAFLYYALPYLFGGVAMLALAVLAGAKIFLTWWIWLFALVWASSVHYIRRKLRTLGYEVEHHRAAEFMLLAGIPFHRKRNQLEQSLAEEF